MRDNLNIKIFLNTDEIFDSQYIRNKVFCEEQKVSKDIEFDGLDHLCVHFVVYKKNHPIGTARLREKRKGIFKIERVAILKSERLRGTGKFLMLSLIENVRENENLVKLILHSQTQVINFYKKLGFVRTGKEFFEDNIPHVKMIYKFKM